MAHPDENATPLTLPPDYLEWVRAQLNAARIDCDGQQMLDAQPPLTPEQLDLIHARLDAVEKETVRETGLHGQATEHRPDATPQPLSTTIGQYRDLWREYEDSLRELEQQLLAAPDLPARASEIILLVIHERNCWAGYLARQFGHDITATPPQVLSQERLPKTQDEIQQAIVARMKYQVFDTIREVLIHRQPLTAPDRWPAMIVQVFIKGLRLFPQLAVEEAQKSNFPPSRLGAVQFLAGWAGTLLNLGQNQRLRRAIDAVASDWEDRDRALLELLPGAVLPALERWQPAAGEGGTRQLERLRNLIARDLERTAPEQGKRTTKKSVIGLDDGIGSIAAEQEFIAREEALLSQQDDMPELLRAAGLSAQQVAVMELDLAGYKDHEIAQRLGIAPGTVKTHKSRAMKRLREHYAKAS